ERLRELVEADAVHGREPDAAAHDAPEALHLLAQLAVALRDVLARLIEKLTRGRRLDVALRALEQRPVEARFEAADLLAHRGLRDEVLRGGRREAAALDEVAEHLERFEMHD